MYLVLQITLSEVSFIYSYMTAVWDLLKKKISSKINVLRPDEEFLFKFKDTNIPNYSEDHILNNVRIRNPSLRITAQSFVKVAKQ